jgi:iron(III) transport system substrate-binding protein
LPDIFALFIGIESMNKEIPMMKRAIFPKLSQNTGFWENRPERKEKNGLIEPKVRANRAVRLVFTTVFFFILVSAVFGAPQKESAAETGNKLVLYTPVADTVLQSMIPPFEEATGIQVETIAAASGEVFARIQAERDNPACDVTWIPAIYAFQDRGLWEPYVSANNRELPEQYRTSDGIINLANRTCPAIIYNKNLVKFDIAGYEDLLRPELFGKIAHGDAARSSSAFQHLQNMLYDIGKGDPMAPAAWDYVDKFLKQLDGRIVGSSGTIHRGVVDGEFAVGLTWDTPAYTYLSQNIDHVKMVMMKEGVIYEVSGICIIKNAPHLANAKKFVDFVTSKTGQSILGTKDPGANPIRDDIEMPAYKKLPANIPSAILDATETARTREPILAKYQELYMKIFK